MKEDTRRYWIQTLKYIGSLILLCALGALAGLLLWCIRGALGGW